MNEYDKNFHGAKRTKKFIHGSSSYNNLLG